MKRSLSSPFNLHQYEYKEINSVFVFHGDIHNFLFKFVLNIRDLNNSAQILFKSLHTDTNAVVIIPIISLFFSRQSFKILKNYIRRLKSYIN